MYQPQSDQVSVFEDETLFEVRGLDPQNEWIKLAKLIPWAKVEQRYAKTFGSEVGNVAKSARMAIGSLIIKNRYQFSDEDTLQEIRMNPYLQYFIGLPMFQHNAPFDQSTMTLFRKRIPIELLADLNDYITARSDPYKEEVSQEDSDDDSEGGLPTLSGEETKKTEASKSHENELPNHGTLILDATCVPQDICYPTDIGLLNKARQSLEKMIAKSYPVGNKPRTYRKTARRDYLRYAKNRKPGKNLLRRSLRKQLGYVQRDIRHVEKVKDLLSEKDKNLLEVIQTLHRQQKEMFDNKTNRVDNRIVSLHEPWVRPIVRGKVKAPTEFGAKLGISLMDGYARVETLSWDAFHEGTTLKDIVEAYHQDTGFYPERILADKAYRSRENLQYCKEHGIRVSGPKLGRPPKDKALYRQQLHEEWKESGERAEVECVFGVGKRRYSLDRIMMRLQHTSELAIHVSILTMNLWKKLRALLFVLIWTRLKRAEKTLFSLMNAWRSCGQIVFRQKWAFGQLTLHNSDSIY